MSREDAYAVVQRRRCGPPMSARPLRELLALDPAVAGRLSLASLDACFDDAAFLAPRAGGHRPAGRAAARASRRAGRRAGLLSASGEVPVPAADAFVRSGKVRDLFTRRRGAAAAGRERPDQRLRCRPADRDPRQGPRPDRDVALVVRRDGRHRREPPGLDGPADIPDGWFVTEAVDAAPAWSRATSPRSTAMLRGRIMICRRADVLPVEVIVRGYLAGSGWKDYRDTGGSCGDPAAGRPARERPAAGADLDALDQGRAGRHDENIDFSDDGRRSSAAELAERVRDVALRCTATRRPHRARPGSCWPTRSSSSGLERPPASCSSSMRS